MKSILIGAAAALGFAGVAFAEGPSMLTDDQMDQIVAGMNFQDGQPLFVYQRGDDLTDLRYQRLKEGQEAPNSGGGDKGPWTPYSGGSFCVWNSADFPCPTQ